MRLAIRSWSLNRSAKFGVAISAAAEGVGALSSETKSQIVKSVSCPTAEITGIADANITLASPSSLNDHNSSRDPPPLPIIIVSTGWSWLKKLIPSIRLGTEPFPWTKAGNSFISTFGYLLVTTFIISLITAPVSDVTTPIDLGNLGIGFL